MKKLGEEFVKVRVVKMNGVDIGLFQFDFDLTWMCFFMNANGYTYGRYGMRKNEHAEGMLSTKGLVKAMHGALDAHKTDSAKKPAEWTRRTADSIKAVPEPIKSGKNCMHCHMVWGFERRDAPISKEAAQELYPLPENLGITMDVDDPNVVKSVEGAAKKAGVAPGDRVTAINGARVLSSADIAFALHTLPKGGEIKIEIGGKSVVVVPEGDWRKRDISWRSTMWALKPAPGFGGKMLTDAEKKRDGVDAPWAMKVNYIVDWGDQAALGKAIKAAGLAKEDIVVSIAGKNDFASELAMQTWFRLTQKGGTEIEVVFWRKGEKKTIKIPVVE